MGKEGLMIKAMLAIAVLLAAGITASIWFLLGFLPSHIEYWTWVSIGGLSLWFLFREARKYNDRRD